jgi:hypothetical protein
VYSPSLTSGQPAVPRGRLSLSNLSSFRGPPQAAIGDDLVTVPGKSIFIKSEAPSGLLYLFVNDLWQTAGDNGGGPKLSIEPFEEAEIKAQGPLYTLKNKVEEEPDGPPNETNEWVRFPPRETRGKKPMA